MSSSLAVESPHTRDTPRFGALPFGVTFLAVAVGACAMAGLMPLGFSIVAVFLFAGPHNWMEARFFLSRVPARWGRLKWYYTVGLGGVLLLFAGSLLLPSVARSWQWGRGDLLIGIGAWNSALVLWIMAIAELRRRETGDDRWQWVHPIGLAIIAVNWLWPLAWSLALVYLHPIVALWFLDRELGRRRPAWQRAYRRCLPVVPLLLVALWCLLAGAADLPGDDLLSLQIANHAGASVLTGVSSRVLVASHVFLEMLHYVAWILVIPLIGYAGTPWTLKKIPLAGRSRVWKRAVAGVLIAGVAVTFALWAGFVADYPLTRDVYFSVAILHVLAEVPFLLRLL